jgi:uroporphyrin-III C-methyltransferase
MPHSRYGRVQLVGAGPGAADLLTLRALSAIKAADVILFDTLVSEEIRALFPPSARAIEVGKRGHRASTPQDFINRLMVRFARAGAAVVRLKGGDPSIFGRATEEREFLEAAGLSVEVIPGVTIATAAAAEFGFSLTARETARRVLFATGRTLHGAAGDWRLAGDRETTLCLYMGCGDIAGISSQLISAGRDPETPAIAAINVSLPGAKIICSTLERLPADLSGASANAPVFISVGAVVALARPRLHNEELETRSEGAIPPLMAAPVAKPKL